MKKMGLFVLASISILMFAACSSNNVTQKELESKTWQLESDQEDEEIYFTVNFNEDTMSMKYNYAEGTESTASNDWEKLGEDYAKKMIENMSFDVTYKINGGQIHLKNTNLDLDDDYVMSKDGEKIIFTSKNDKEAKMILTPSSEKKSTAKSQTIQSNATNATSQTTETKTSSKSESSIYGLGEEWEVPGQWKFKIDSVTPTEDRNQFSDKTPAQVVIITYTYENLGYESSIQDLFFSNFKVSDSANQMAEAYPATVTTNPQPTPVGATCSGAQVAYGLATAGGNIKIYVEKTDADYKMYKATFEVPIQ